MDSRPLGRAGEGPPVSSGNSVGVAFSQPRVEGRSASTLGIYIIRCSNSDGVAVSRRRYHNAIPSLPISRGIIQLSITPTAKRNSYRVAILVGALPRVAGHARNPGLCNRNSYRVALGRPLPGPPQGAGVHTCCVLGYLVELLPLGEGWDGASGAGEGLRVAGDDIGGLVPFDTRARAY